MNKNYLYYSIVVIFVFLLDRLSKLYVLNLAESEQVVDVYITPYLNLYLIWNTGVGFGILSSNQEFFYNTMFYNFSSFPSID